MRIVAGTARGRKIEAPPGDRTRPTLDRVRENLFNILQGYIQGSRVLDLFAGSGALGLEAVSRGAEAAVLVDSDRRASAVQKSNTDHLGFSDQIRIYCCDWHKYFSDYHSGSELFDLVFLDPPYAMTDMNEVFQALIPVISSDAYIILEHQTNVQPSVPECFEVIKQRSWGFCSVNIYRIKQ